MEPEGGRRRARLRRSFRVQQRLLLAAAVALALIALLLVLSMAGSVGWL